MDNYTRGFLERGRAGVLLDTNILLLFVVGSFAREQIPQFKRTIMFTKEDYDILDRFLMRFESIVTTPNILTEVSNLSGQWKGRYKDAYFKVLAHSITLLNEHYLPSDEISNMEEFKSFGLTDAGMLQLARDRYLVVTDDLSLYQYLLGKGVAAINFNHIRVESW